MSQRRPVAAGNWKMNTTPEEGISLCRELLATNVAAGGAEVIVFPPFTHLAGAREVLAGSPIALGAQNLFWEPSGAYTGEISASMICAFATHVLIGHSERRQYFGESDETVRKKLVAALGAELVPVVCVGESLAERDAGMVETVLDRQVRGALLDVAFDSMLILAYEPVWAIGTGRAATPEQADAAMGFMRNVVASVSSGGLAEQIRILYGGSVTAQNVSEFIHGPHVDGALVGGASLKAESFAEIARRIGATAD
jgi:triosephosphate isomerase